MKSSKLIIRKRRKFPRGLWAALAVLVIAGGAAGWYFLLGPGSATANAQSNTSTQTYTTVVRRGDISISASGSGKLAAGQTADLSFPTGGLVAELNVQTGDMVKKGDVLARLGNTDSLKAAVAQAQVDLLTAQQALSTYQTGSSMALAQAYQALVTAQTSYNTDLQAEQRTAYARCSQDVLTRDKARVDNALTKLNQVTAREEGPTHSSVWIDANNAYQTALANYNYCAAYTPDEITSAQSKLAVAKVSLQQAQQTYDTLKAGSGLDPNTLAVDEASVTAAQTKLTNAQQNLTNAQIVAPFDGKVTYLASGVGTMAGTSTYITVSDVNQPIVNISIDETDVSKLTPGAAVTVVFDALPDQTFTGKVTQVDPQLTASGQYSVATGVVALDMDPAKALQNLPLGLNASVTVIDKQAKNALLVPVTSLIDLGGGQYGVMAVGSDGQMKMQVVQVGLQDGTNAQVLSGLTQGETIRTDLSGSAAGTGSSTTNSSSRSSGNNRGFGGGGGFIIQVPGN